MNTGGEWGRTIFGEVYERWPKDANGQPEEPKFLCRCKGLDFEADMRTGMLDAYAIPCLWMYPGDGSLFGKVVLGMSGFGVDLYVPASRLDEARALCENESEE